MGTNHNQFQILANHSIDKKILSRFNFEFVNKYSSDPTELNNLLPSITSESFPLPLNSPRGIPKISPIPLPISLKQPSCNVNI